jgi:hypothetical protein
MPQDQPRQGQTQTPEILSSSIVKLYSSAQKFFKAFIGSKHPNTICWLLEILYLIADKFKAEDPALNKKLKTELSSTLEALLKASS